MVYQENLKGYMKKATSEQQTGKKLPRLHTMTKLTNLTPNKTAVTTIIMKPPGQNRVTTMKETLTDSSQVERWVGRRWYRQWQTAKRKLVHDNHVTRPRPAH